MFITRIDRSAAVPGRGSAETEERLDLFETAGASPNSAPEDGRTPLRRAGPVHLCWIPLLLFLLIGLVARGQVVSDCTQAALEEALAGGGTVTFDCDGVIVLTNTMVISTDTVLDGTGHAVTISTITGTNATNAVRLFEVDEDVSFEIINLKLADGRSTNGAAIFNRGFLTATSCTFSNNQALGFNGRDGANGRDHPDDNAGGDGRNGTAGAIAAGGAIHNIGQAAFSACAFLTNAAGGGNGGAGGRGGEGRRLGGDGGRGGRGGAGYGGAIFNGGDLSLTDCTFNFNFVIGGEGGPGGSNGVSQAFSGDRGVGAAAGLAQGGAIYNAATGVVSVVSSTFALNQCQGGNSADGGTRSGRGPAGPNGGQGSGGALFNNGQTTLINCTFFANLVAGGGGGDGSAGSFQGGRGGHGGAAWGGSVYNYRRIAATNCTFSDGGTIGGTNGAGGAGPLVGPDGKRGVARGGNLANARGAFYLKNCVIAYASPGTNGHGRFMDMGYNLSSDRSMVLRGPGSLVNTNPLLGILAANGGPTQTIALQEGSPAIDRGDPVFCLPTDQRGVVRPLGAGCDIGAYEYGVLLTAPTIVIQPQDREVQVGGTVTFSVLATGDSPLRYQWRQDETELPGETESTLVIVGADAASAGSYDVVVSNNSGSVTSEPATLNVLEPVTIISDPVSVTVTPGATALFSVAVEGDEPLSFQWLFNGAPILGATLDTLAVENAQSDKAGSYQVVVSNPFSSATSLPATLTIATTPPSFITQPTNQTVSVGQTVTFSAMVNGTPPMRYRWFFNQTTLISQMESMSLTATLTIPNVQPANDGAYHLVVSNLLGATSSAPFTLTVQTMPLVIAQQPTNVTVGTGEKAVFGVSVTGSAPHFFQWHFNGTFLSGATNPVLTITNAQSTNVGGYRVVITNLFGGMVTSDLAMLQVVDLAPTNLVVTPSGVITNIGIGGTLQLEATVSGSRPLEFQWFLDNLLLVNETNATLTITNVTADYAGPYTVEAVNDFGRATSAPVVVVLETTSALTAGSLESGLPAASSRLRRPRRRRCLARWRRASCLP